MDEKSELSDLIRLAAKAGLSAEDKRRFFVLLETRLREFKESVEKLEVEAKKSI